MGTVMGIVNVTPDSFSDGGDYLDPAAAIAHGRELVRQGADVIDVGGESTRPGAEPVDPSVEQERVLPVIEALSNDVRISVDTRHADTARAAVAAGASVLNDVSASLDAVAAELGVAWIGMHMRGEPGSMQDDPRYDDVVEEVADHLAAGASRARAVGVREVYVDPGIGFGKRAGHNLALLANLDRFTTIAPVVVGVSRKQLVGWLHARSDGRPEPVPVDDRREGSVALATWAFSQGVHTVRAHDVRATVHAARVVG